MSNIEVKKIVKQYAHALKNANYPFTPLYLFGSHARGKARPWSDIDVAVVSNKLKKNFDQNRFKLWHIRLDVDTRIEPHGFTIKDFTDDVNPMAYEIRKNGIRVV